MALIVALFSKVIPTSIEMLDEKSRILSEATRVLPILDKEIGRVMRSYRDLNLAKRQMGAFSTREQNDNLRKLRLRHADIAPTVGWILSEIATFYSNFWFTGDTNKSMITILEMHDDLLKYVKG